MNNDKAYCDFAGKTCHRIAGMSQELGQHFNGLIDADQHEYQTVLEDLRTEILNTLEKHLPELHEVKEGVKSLMNLSPRMQDAREELVKGIEYFIKYEDCLKDKFSESVTPNVAACNIFMEASDKHARKSVENNK